MKSGKVLLIGLGSIGSLHFRTAGEFFLEVFVIDPNKSKLDDFNELKKELKTDGSFFLSIDQIPKNLTFDLCVIANWGPDHFQTFEDVAALGCKSFIIEKPLASKLSDLYKLQEISIKHNVRIIANLQTNYSHFSEKVFELTNKYQIGSLLGLYVSGGAKCVATNGIHYLALANQLFDEWPTSVFAELGSDPINPRGRHLSFFDGVANWTYPSKRNFSIHFHNDCRLSTTLRVIFQYGYIEVVNNNYKLYAIDREIVDGFTKPAHTSSATTLLSEGDAFESTGVSTPMKKLYASFLAANRNESTLDVGFHATEEILGALISSTLGVKVRLDDLASDYPEHLETDWKIS